MKSLTFWIPGHVPSPNWWRAQGTRRRMSEVKRMRDKALMLAHKAMLEKKVAPFTGAARIRFEVMRERFLDPRENLPYSLKFYVDGLCKNVLPAGDGPKSPYTWEPPTQIQCEKENQGVLVMIEEDEPGDAPGRPFSGNPR